MSSWHRRRPFKTAHALVPWDSFWVAPLHASDAPVHLVLADLSQLERVVGNLLTNALKYSGKNTPVKVRIAREGDDVVLEVIDRGIGVAPENLSMLFHRYYRTPEGKARASGLGLGLYIARLIVEAHGGRLEVASTVGEGSTFRLVLPAHVSHAP